MSGWLAAGGLLYACTLAACQTPAPDAARMLPAQRAYAQLQQYAAQAPYRTGSVADAALFERLSTQLRDMGYRVQIERSGFDRFRVRAQQLQVGDFAPQVLALEYSGRTDAQGIAAPLVDVTGGDFSAARGAIAVARVPLVMNFFAPTLDAVQRKAHAAGARALIVAFDREDNAIVAKNVDARSGLCGLPVLLVGAQDGERLRALAGKPARFVLDAVLEPGTLRNLVATLPGRSEDMLMVGTPVNGWFEAATERGAGVGLWLTLAERYAHKAAAGETPAKTLVFVASGGHEVGYLGLDALMAAHPEWPPRIAAYVHLGASLAVREQTWVDGRLQDLGAASPLTFYVSENPLLMSLAQQTLRDGDRFLGNLTPASLFNPGEQRVMYAQGVPMIAGSASHEAFHTPRDTPALSSAPLMAPVLSGYAGLIDALLEIPTTRLHASNQLARTLAKAGARAPSAAQCAVPLAVKSAPE